MKWATALRVCLIAEVGYLCVRLKLVMKWTSAFACPVSLFPSLGTECPFPVGNTFHIVYIRLTPFSTRLQSWRRQRLKKLGVTWDLEAPIPPGLQQQKMAVVDKSRDRALTRIPFMTSEASNPKPGHQPIRNSETFPCLLFLFSLFPQGLAVKPLDQKGLVCVQQQSRMGVGVAWGRRLHCTAAAKLEGRKAPKWQSRCQQPWKREKDTASLRSVTKKASKESWEPDRV